MTMKILVSTDFSLNSKAGIRFAIQLASQKPASLIFFHVIELLIPAKWNEVKARVHMNREIKHETARLQKFVKEIYKESNRRPRNIECVVRYGAPVYKSIIDLALEKKAGFIVMSSRGAGQIRRIIGTHTSAMIQHSPLAVFSIPRNYRPTEIDHILYASDLTDLKSELKKVKVFAASVHSKVSVLHYDYFLQIKEAKDEFQKAASAHRSANVTFHLQRFDWEESLASHLKKAIRKFKPSMIVLFTQQDRNWYQRILFSSKSVDISYDTKKPVLVFPKSDEQTG